MTLGGVTEDKDVSKNPVHLCSGDERGARADGSGQRGGALLLPVEPLLQAPRVSKMLMAFRCLWHFDPKAERVLG